MTYDEIDAAIAAAGYKLFTFHDKRGRQYTIKNPNPSGGLVAWVVRDSTGWHLTAFAANGTIETQHPFPTPTDALVTTLSLIL